eukprot:gene6531-10087_t
MRVAPVFGLPAGSRFDLTLLAAREAVFRIEAAPGT